MKDIIKTALSESFTRPYKLIVYTAIFNDYDFLKAPEFQDSAILYVCFTDKPIEQTSYSPWKQIILPTIRSPRYMARYLKAKPHEFFPKDSITLWVDGSFKIMNAPHWSFKLFLQQYPIVAFHHPLRNNPYEEGDAVVAQIKDLNKEEVRNQCAEYYKTGFFPKVLTTTGFLLRRLTPEMAEFGEAFAKELFRWDNLRDQLVIDFVAKVHGLRIGYLPGHYRNNEYVDYYTHGRATPSGKFDIDLGKKEWLDYLI